MKEEEFSPEMMQKSVAGWVTVQDELRREVLERVRAARDRKRVAASTGSMANFEVGDYVLVARDRKLGSAPKLVTTWTGPWRVVSGGSPHVYNVQDIVTVETKEVHVVRMHAYADSSLAIGAEVQGLFEMTTHQGEYEIQDILNIGEDPISSSSSGVCGSSTWRKGWHPQKLWCPSCLLDAELLYNRLHLIFFSTLSGEPLHHCLGVSKDVVHVY